MESKVKELNTEHWRNSTVFSGNYVKDIPVGGASYKMGKRMLKIKGRSSNYEATRGMRFHKDIEVTNRNDGYRNRDNRDSHTEVFYE